jgi:sirohydrochlorin ferrochelatase
MTAASKIYLIDNGSLRPQAVFALRDIALTLSKQIHQDVQPVSVLHSHKITPDKLKGIKARVVKEALLEDIDAGATQFTMIPLFLGPSLAITDYLPKVIAECISQYPKVNVTIAESLAGPDVDHPDSRLTSIAVDHIAHIAEAQPSRLFNVAFVDHGTPHKPVNSLRNAVAQQIAAQCSDKLGKDKLIAVNHVVACSMERREGDEYAFNDPLLENLATQFGENCEEKEQHWIVALFFLLPGRHAGEGGDIAEICQSLVAQTHISSLTCTPLMGEHPLLIEILADRYHAAVRHNADRQSNNESPQFNQK